MADSVYGSLHIALLIRLGIAPQSAADGDAALSMLEISVAPLPPLLTNPAASKSLINSRIFGGILPMVPLWYSLNNGQDIDATRTIS